MSTISKNIDEIINLELKALMKSQGYKKKARNFYKELDGGMFLIVNVQASIYNDTNEGQFTINFGVYFPEIYEFVGFGNKSVVPTIPDCSTSKRIGQLLPEGKDYWWKITPKSDFIQIAKELSGAVENYGLPWLKNNSSLVKASKELKNQNPFTAAATAMLEGNKNEASKIINGIISKGSAAKSRAVFWQKKYNLKNT